MLPFFFFWLHHAAYRILVPQPGMEPANGVLTAGPPGKSYMLLNGRKQRCCKDCKHSTPNSNVGMCWGEFTTPPSKQFLDPSCVSYNSAPFWHYLPGDSVRFHRLRVHFYKTVPHTNSLPNFRCQSQVQIVICTPDYKSEVPMTPPPTVVFN